MDLQQANRLNLSNIIAEGDSYFQLGFGLFHATMVFSRCYGGDYWFSLNTQSLLLACEEICKWDGKCSYQGVIGRLDSIVVISLPIDSAFFSAFLGLLCFKFLSFFMVFLFLGFLVYVFYAA